MVAPKACREIGFPQTLPGRLMRGLSVSPDPHLWGPEQD